MAREMHPGQRNSLDALCKRYEVDATKRDVHGALIDSELLANVYLAMTGGQTAMLVAGRMLLRSSERDPVAASGTHMGIKPTPTGNIEGSRPGHPHGHKAAPTVDLPVVQATVEESAAHDAMLEKIRKSGACVWDID